MTDIKNALAQLRAARNMDDRNVEEAQRTEAVASTPATLNESPSVGTETDPPAVARGEIKTLAGRVPLPLHRELTRALLDAADELHLNKINVDEALEAAMRVVLRDAQATALWYAQLREVRRERRES